MIDQELQQLIRQIRLVAFDFDGVFTDNTVIVSEDGIEFVRCWRGDGIGLRLLEQLGLACVILSTEENPVVLTRSRKLAVPCRYGCKDKLATLKEIAAERNIPLEAIAFVGNDINDAGCLQAVGLPIVVQDAHPDVLPLARFRTTTPGGYGAVREVCDLFKNVLQQTEGKRDGSRSV
ncbi:KdsC family phosphatase [Kallotenue papyrolyticum]|uniref:KdsC family phosphatase n=1 Tax=Kallotenue papyrolyticum TaxID=1325125 RepID=UPI0009DEE06B|nr:HAD hydrolase family protein [Kallotenue papyrolyticum]